MANSVSRTLILDEAARRGLTTETIGPNGFFLKITHPDGRSTMVRGSRPSQTSSVGYEIAKQKNLTMELAKFAGYTVPASILLADESEAEAFLARYSWIVLKPADGQQSRGVTVAVTDRDQLAVAYKHALEYSDSKTVIAQEHLDGNLYRVLVIGGRFAGSVLRAPALVVGDGVKTVAALIAQANLDPRRAGDSAFKQIDLAAAEAYVGAERLNSVLALNESLIVAKVISMGSGGESITVTDDVHPDWRQACIELANQAGLFVAGYDIICPDISQPRQGDYFPLIEINSAPSLGLHELASSGEPSRVTALLLDALFPEV